MVNYLLIFITVVGTAIGQIILKYGQSSLYFPKDWSVKEIILATASNITNVYFILAFLCSVIGAVSWSFAIQKSNLSFAYSFMSATYVLVVLASYFLFKESIIFLRFLGAVFIVVGLVLINIKQTL